MTYLGPLKNGQRVAVIGAGPAGASAALTLRRVAAHRNIRLDVSLFEGKRFGEHHNQCLGVLSPPLLSVLKENLGIELPESLIQRYVRGYVLASSSREILLDCPPASEASHAVRRVELDAFLLGRVEQSGVSVVRSRVSDIEIGRDEVVVFSESGNCCVDAVVGAFGLDRSMAAVFRKRTSYRPPLSLETIVAKIHPADLERIEGLLSDRIYAYLPPVRGVEFGALVPKGNHIAVIVAGKDVRSADMDSFLELPEVARLLPRGARKSEYFKGSFPLGLASGTFGHRYVITGDAAGLVRPFKGKGINTAILTGRLAALTMLDGGVSASALRSFHDECRDLRADVAYGRFMRRLAILTSNYSSVSRVISLAEKDPRIREALFDCVSGNRSFRDIVRRNLRFSVALPLARALLLEGVLDRLAQRFSLRPGGPNCRKSS
ncbi:MAG: hypothetical protein V2A71_00145 [Candidatus Eisenbacteria bacterium]